MNTANTIQPPMVDENKILSVVKRLFNGTIREVFGELLQNSQRAGAKAVWITTSPDGEISVRDNGSGLHRLNAENGNGDIILYSDQSEYIESMFAPLMKIASSAYDRESVADQDPMGVGLFSLFALEGVTVVRITSGGFMLTIDTFRLWNEDGYWQKWRQFVSKAPDAANTGKGVEIVISANSDLISKVQTEFNRRYCSGNPAGESPACGYEGILEVFFNTKPLDTSCGQYQKMDEKFIETSYQGNRLLIGANNYASANTVNWFGQLIPTGSTSFRYYLEVREGRPLSPLSPSRRGIIKDAKWEEFQTFLKTEMRKYILETPPEEISALAVDSIYRIDKVWADEKCPYLTASELIHDEDSTSFQEWQWQEKKSVVLTYTGNPILLDDTVYIISDTATEPEQSSDETALTSAEYQYGAISFIPAIRDAVGEAVYELKAGNRSRLNIRKLWWKPGRELESFFAENGEFQITAGTIDDDKTQNPTVENWRAVGTHTVFAFEMEENWNIESCESLIVGVRDTLADKIQFLNTAAWCLWSYENDESNGDEMEADFRSNLEECKAELFGDSLPDETFDLWKLRSYFGLTDGEGITTLEFAYGEKNDAAAMRRPDSVTLHTDKNRSVKRRFVSSLESGLSEVQ